jgi:signal transduction histidine kinase
VLRHSRARSAVVTLAERDGQLEIRVTDDGPAREDAPALDDGPARVEGAASDGGTGYGLIGVRQRAAALGGSVTAQPRPEGGFELHAVLPLAMAPA